MADIWVPMDSGVIVATLEKDGGVSVRDQIAMELRPVNLKTGFADKEDGEDG